MVNLDQLKAKYQKVLDLGKARGVSWKNIHLENDKLLIRGAAPNEAIKNEVWTAIKAIDPAYADLTVDLGVDASLPAPAAAPRHPTRSWPATRSPRSRSRSTATLRSTRRSSRPTGIS